MVNIPDSVFKQYKDAVDDMINLNFGVNCKIIYPPINEECPICTAGNTMIGARGTNRYSHGGPMPNPIRGCSYCEGTGIKQTTVSDTIKMRIYFNTRQWIKVANIVNVPDGSVQVIGFMSDLPKFIKADKIIVNSDQENNKLWVYERHTEPVPHGFGHDRYFICILKRSG